MANTTKKRIVGRMIDLIVSPLTTGGVALTTWTEFDMSLSVGEWDAPAASSEYDQFVTGRKGLTGSVKGWIGDGNSLPELPQPGDEIKTFSAQTITEGADLLVTLPAYGPIVVLSVDYSQADDPSQFTMNFKAGAIIDTPAA